MLRGLSQVYYSLALLLLRLRDIWPRGLDATDIIPNVMEHRAAVATAAMRRLASSL